MLQATGWWVLLGTSSLVYGATSADPHAACDGSCSRVPPVAASLGSGGPGGLWDTTGFPPRWECGTAWTPLHGWAHILSDLAIWGAYMAIPVILVVFLKNRATAFPPVFWFFVAFIAACGTGHLIEAAIFWWPVYRVSAVVKVSTAVVSWVTVLAMAPFLKRALRWPALEREIDQREAVEKDLKQTNIEVDERNRQLQQIVYTVSHDLKSPLVSIRGLVDFLRLDLGRGRTDRVNDFVARIEQASERMHHYIQDLLEYARVEPKNDTGQATDAASVAQAVLEQHRDEIAKRRFRVTLHKGLPRLKIEPSRMERLLDNLVTNAIKYAGSVSAPAMEIGSDTAADGSVRLWVRDNGPGIPEGMEERVFELFERLGVRDESGTGIGLAVVRQIAESHEGHAWVERPVSGTGAVFYISFPAHKRG